MSLEQALAANTAAMEANTAALLGKASNASTTSSEKTATTSTPKDKPAAKDKPATKTKPAHSREEMVTALTDVKEKLGLEETRALFAPIEKMKDIPEDKIDEIYKAAKAKLAEDAGGDNEGDGL